MSCKKRQAYSDNIPYEKIGDAVTPLEVPFDIPDSWEWCRAGDLFTNMSGLAYKKDSLSIKSDSMVRVLRGGNIGSEQYTFKADDVFISDEFVKPELLLRKNYMITPAVSSLDHIGKIALIEKNYSDVVVGGFVLMLIPFFDDDIISKYLLYAFAAKHHRDNCRSITHKSGQAFYNLSRELLMNLPVPIPPRSEMKRIVEQIELILPFIQNYVDIEESLNKLNTTFPDRLKKSILQMAVQGKLVPQDPADEPAEALLARIREEKQRLIKEGKIKKDKHESVIFRRDNSHYEKLDGIERCIDDEIPFEIPDSWEWTRLGNCIHLMSGQDFEPSDYNENGNGIPYITGASNIIEGKIVINRWTPSPRCVAECGQLLIVCKGAGVGKMAILDAPRVHIARQLMAIYTVIASKQYIQFYIQHNLSQIRRNMQGVIPGISRIDMLNLLLPLPPLEEQHRIVEKIEEILSAITLL